MQVTNTTQTVWIREGESERERLCLCVRVCVCVCVLLQMRVHFCLSPFLPVHCGVLEGEERV